ncbi:radical SAM protein [Thermogutta sp.]|jgi:wyosine [tRNA(Phe)-imidazoG37] synthetase (radical SAM superfamily)|uniref:radical SAM protein n=1 Tax=Thermogutta sp. TaxID=1962930 RepID=UPI0032203A3C
MSSPDHLPAVFTRHERSFGSFRFVYPVVSRRAGGVSIGVNLNPDKICNFDCVYCQVDRREMPGRVFVEMDRLREELHEAIRLVRQGELFAMEKFVDTPLPLRHLRDIAFSGDGEPTTFTNFEQICQLAADVRQTERLDEVKLVLITNASMFHRPGVQRGLAILDAHGGEIWAKLDAGTEEYFQRIARTSIPFRRILENITQAARIRPLVIQSLFMRLEGQAPPAAEIAAYCERLNEILEVGGQIKLVQIYSVARPPAESFVSALSRQELEAIADQVQASTGLTTAVYP